ncbi:putative TBC1 domain family member 2A [Blattamonas nauphoetae]|uniref:TBC1 domain family member 2A n=1 Tax=Blattamonas nauphoetae TaxID=2049346 RepID=A0ABQ9XB23_9EUKA|nr:putative TBC1 domain family member 2A [Blattamonas nauphoetae]
MRWADLQLMNAPPPPRPLLKHSLTQISLRQQPEFDFWYGFPQTGFSASELLKVRNYSTLLLQREMEWDPIARADPHFSNFISHPRCRELCRKGIPPKHRPYVWISLLEVKTVRKPGLFSRYLSHTEEENAATLRIISSDLQRTFPTHPLFTPNSPTLCRIRDVLLAYTWHDSITGYCQSMSYIVGMLALIFDSAEDLFWVFVQVMRRMPKYYGRTLKEIRIDMHVMDLYMQKHAPELFSLLHSFSLTAENLCMDWFLTAFCRGFPPEISFRFWDIIFSEGWKALFRISLGLCKRIQSVTRGITDKSPISAARHFCEHLIDVEPILTFGYEIKRFPKRDIEAKRADVRKIIDAETRQGLT